MMKQITLPVRLSALLALVLSLSLIYGCGGGGGGGGDTSSNGNATVSGRLMIDSNTPAVNYNVILVADPTVKTTTNSSGVFSLSVDATKYNGSQTIRITDTNGNTIDNESVTVSSTGGTYSLGSINIGPPAPPV